MSHSRTKSTAKKGNPKEASRGNAVGRARLAFHAAHDAYIWQIELGLLAILIGLPANAPEADIKARLDTATIEEFEAWTASINSRQSAGAAA